MALGTPPRVADGAAFVVVLAAILETLERDGFLTRCGDGTERDGRFGWASRISRAPVQH